MDCQNLRYLNLKIIEYISSTSSQIFYIIKGYLHANFCNQNDLILAQPHRRYLREGYLMDVDEKKKVYYFLFNDLLIGTKKKTHKRTTSHSFKYLYRIPLNVASIRYYPTGSIFTNIFGIRLTSYFWFFYF
jgi:hypothetical protein